MKVLQIHARYRNESGEDTVVDAEAALLRSAGHEVVPVHAASPTRRVPAVRLLVQSPWNVPAARTVERGRDPGPR